MQAQTLILSGNQKENVATVTATESNTFKSSIAGTFAGFARVITGQPFDTVKVRLQATQGEYTGTIDCAKKIIRQEGIAAFYKGTLTPLLAVGVCGSIQFAGVEEAKSYFRRQNNGGDLNYTQLYWAGGFAGLINSVVSGPVEQIRSRLQMQRGKGTKEFSGPLDCARKIHAAGGWKGLYRGQAVTVLREFQAYAGYFLTYEFMIRNTMAYTGKTRKQLNYGHVMLCGAVGGFGMWVPVYAIDVVKSKLQVDGFGPNQKYFGTMDCIRKTYAAEGLRGFFRGFMPCMLRAAPVNASTFLAFEMAMSVMGVAK